MGNKLVNLKTELEKTWETCQTPNWDGYDAYPISNNTLKLTQSLLNQLPDITKPDIGAEPNGSLTLEWFKNANSILSISVNQNFSYAFIHNKSKSFGTTDDINQIIQIILNFLEIK